MSLLELSSSESFEKSVREGVSLVDFNAPWCAPCRSQEPIIKSLADKYAKQAMIAAINIDENQNLAMRLGIKSIPTIIIFKNGKEIQRFVGLQSESKLSFAIDAVLQ